MKVFKNIREVKTTIIGVSFCVAAFLYLFHYEGENNTIFFGLLGLGIFLMFSPDTIFKSGSKILLRLLGANTKQSECEILDEESSDSDENEIPNER